MESLSSRRRSEGETAFPEIAVIVEEVMATARGRRAAEERERRMSDEAAERRRRETYPEDYIATDEIKAMAERIGRKCGMGYRSEAQEPVKVLCPHCSAELPVAPNIRLWEPEELRLQADMLEEIRRIATVNREANNQLGSLPATEEVA
jgi:hypothetical protein